MYIELCWRLFIIFIFLYFVFYELKKLFIKKYVMNWMDLIGCMLWNNNLFDMVVYIIKW